MSMRERVRAWSRRKKVVVGLIAAYACAVALMIAEMFWNRYTSSHPPESVWELIGAGYWWAYLGVGIAGLTLREALVISVLLLPLAAFAFFPRRWLWILAALSLNLWLMAILMCGMGRAVGEAFGETLKKAFSGG